MAALRQAEIAAGAGERPVKNPAASIRSRFPAGVVADILIRNTFEVLYA